MNGSWFAANAWNVSDLHFRKFTCDFEIDHDWHEFEKVEETEESITTESSIDDFLIRIKNKSNKPLDEKIALMIF